MTEIWQYNFSNSNRMDIRATLSHCLLSDWQLNCLRVSNWSKFWWVFITRFWNFDNINKWDRSANSIRYYRIPQIHCCHWPNKNVATFWIMLFLLKEFYKSDIANTEKHLNFYKTNYIPNKTCFVWKTFSRKKVKYL